MKLNLPELNFCFTGDSHLAHHLSNHLTSVGILLGLIPEPKQLLGDDRISITVAQSVTQDSYQFRVGRDGTLVGVRFFIQVSNFDESKMVTAVNEMLYDLWGELLVWHLPKDCDVNHQTFTTLMTNISNATKYIACLQDTTRHSWYWAIGKLVVEETLSLLHFERRDLPPVNFVRLYYNATPSPEKELPLSVMGLTLSLCSKTKYSAEFSTPDVYISSIDPLGKGNVQLRSVFEQLCMLPETKLLFERSASNEENQEPVGNTD